MSSARSVSRTAHLSVFETLRACVVVGALSLALAAAATAITLPPGWSHAQINVIIKHEGHTLIYDRGLVTSVAALSLTLKEQDGSIVLIPVSPSAVVTLSGRPTTLSRLRRGYFASTERVDGAPAAQVHARRKAGAA